MCSSPASADAPASPSCAIVPYILIRRADGTSTTDDADGSLLRCRWLRSGSRQREQSGLCSVYPGSPAALQSVQFKTFHCGPECFVASWREAHRQRVLTNGATPLAYVPARALGRQLTRPSRAVSPTPRRPFLAVSRPRQRQGRRRRLHLQAQRQHQLPGQQQRRGNVVRGGPSCQLTCHPALPRLLTHKRPAAVTR